MQNECFRGQHGLVEQERHGANQRQAQAAAENRLERWRRAQLLRPRHLVMVASLREQVITALTEQPLATDAAVFEVAGAHLYEQARRDAFRRLAAKERMMIGEPVSRAQKVGND